MLVECVVFDHELYKTDDQNDDQNIIHPVGLLPLAVGDSETLTVLTKVSLWLARRFLALIALLLDEYLQCLEDQLVPISNSLTLTLSEKNSFQFV